MKPLTRALSFLALMLGFQVQGAYLFDEYQEYPVDYSDEKKDNSPDKKAQCNEPVAPEFGKVLVVGNFIEVGSRAIFTCEKGREMVGSMTSKCLDSLEWSFPPPKCVKKCSVPNVHHGRIVRPFFRPWRTDRWTELPVGQILEDNATLEIRCDDKYEPFGNPTLEETVTCKDGEWSPVPQCEP
ncbi:protein lev-9, partial [Trichonephila clavata]